MIEVDLANNAPEGTINGIVLDCFLEFVREFEERGLLSNANRLPVTNQIDAKVRGMSNR